MSEDEQHEFSSSEGRRRKRPPQSEFYGLDSFLQIFYCTRFRLYTNLNATSTKQADDCVTICLSRSRHNIAGGIGSTGRGTT